MHIHIQSLGAPGEDSFGMGDEAPCKVSVAIDPYQTRYMEYRLVSNNLECKRQARNVLSNVFCCDFSVGAR
jgi:hypothetical protein